MLETFVHAMIRARALRVISHLGVGTVLVTPEPEREFGEPCHGQGELSTELGGHASIIWKFCAHILTTLESRLTARKIKPESEKIAGRRTAL